MKKFGFPAIRRVAVFFLSLVFMFPYIGAFQISFAAETLPTPTAFAIELNGVPVVNGTDLSLTDKITVSYKFDLKESMMPDILAGKGSTEYNVPLPRGLVINPALGSVIENILYQGTGGSFILGTLNFDTVNNRAYIVFADTNDLENLYNNLDIIPSFWLEFTQILNASLIGNSVSYTITLPNNETITGGVKENMPTPPVITEKSGVYNENTRTIDWTVTFSAGNPAKADAVFVDVLGEGQSFVEGTLKEGVNGAVPAPVVSGVFYDDTTRTITYTPSAPYADSAAVTITYTSKLDDSLFFSGGSLVNMASRNFTNAARLEWNAGAQTSPVKSGSVSVSNNWMKKTFDGYDPATHTATWTLTIKANGSNASNVTVYDQMTKDMTYVSGTLASTPASYCSGVTPSVVSTADPDYPVLSFTLVGTLTHDVTITYRTIVSDEVINASNESVTLSNKAWLTFSWDPGDGAGSRTFTAPEIVKNGATGTSLIKKDYDSYDPVSHKITWRVTVNSNRADLSDITLTDKIPAGQNYSGNLKSVSLNGVANAAYPIVYFLSGSNHTFTIADEAGTGKLGTNCLVFTFETQITDSAFLHGNDSKSFSNTVSMSALASGVCISPSATATKSIPNNVITKTCEGYDYGTQQFTWKIRVNNTQVELENAVVTDIIPVNQTLVTAGSAFAPSDISLSRVAGTMDTSPITHTASFDMATGTLSVSLGSIYDCYELTFHTKLSPDAVEPALNANTNNVKTRVISNSATLAMTSYNSVTSVANKTINNELVGKTHSVDSTLGTASFAVTVNPNRTTLVGAVITDTLDDGLLLDVTSLRLYEGNVSAGGAVTAGAEVLSFAKSYSAALQRLTVTLPTPTNKAYVLTYSADITARSALKNHVELGQMGGATSATAASTISASAASGASGNARGLKGFVTIKKIPGDNLSGALQNVEFGLYFMDNGSELQVQTGKTDANGELIFSNLTIGKTYFIREIASTGRYVTDNVTKYEFTVVSKTQNTFASQALAVSNNGQRIEITNIRAADSYAQFKKVTDTGAALPNAVFGLYDDHNNLVATKNSEPDGMVRFEVAPGQYTIKEIAAPAGYRRSDIVIEFTVQPSDPAGPAVLTNSDTGAAVTEVVNTVAPTGGDGRTDGAPSGPSPTSPTNPATTPETTPEATPPSGTSPEGPTQDGTPPADTPPGTVTIEIKGRGGEPVPGVVVGIYENGELVGSGTTGETGIVGFDFPSRPGMTVRILEVPENYEYLLTDDDVPLSGMEYLLIQSEELPATGGVALFLLLVAAGIVLVAVGAVLQFKTVFGKKVR